MSDDLHHEEHTQFFQTVAPGVKVAHYQIIEKVGAGGMGEVYLATDGKLDRRVALKFLPPHFAADQAFKTRFTREAKSAAALNHPNIITIHEISEWQGRLFIAMEYVEGRSLKDLIDAGAIPYERALDFTIQLCRGLAKAHKAGIIHRDIKAENVLVDEEGQAKILDFGLAKSEGDEQLTQAGTAMGTVNYMSPEQAQGQEVDQRSDIFSLGVLFYQMLTGVLPFKRANVPATLYALVNEQPQPLANSLSDAKAELQQILNAALAKNPDDRYRNADDMAGDLRSLMGVSQLSQVALTASMQAKPAVKSLAVLYLRNLGSSDDEYLSYGITEDLIVDLSRLGKMRVATMRSIMRFKDSDDEPEQIAAKLNVSILLDGSIHRSGDSIRVSAQLFEVSSGNNLWAERWQEPATSLPKIKTALADGITAALDVEATSSVAAVPGSREPGNPQAYEFYLRGKYAFNTKVNTADVEVALGLFRQALDLEPTLLAARAGVAEILIHKGEYQGALDELADSIAIARERNLKLDEAMLLRLQARSYLNQSSWNRASESAGMALKIAVEKGNLVDEADALAVQIDVLSRRAKFDEALQLFERVLEINQKLDDQKQAAQALKNMGTVHLRKGESEKARSLYEQARQMAIKRKDKGLEADCTGNIGLTWFHTGAPDDALQYYTKALTIHEQLGDRAKEALWMNNIAQVHESRGAYRLALEFFEKVSRIDTELGNRGKFALSHGNSAAMHTTLGEYLQAIAMAHESLAIARELDFPLVSASANDTLASAHFFQEEYDLAEEYYQEALKVAEKNGLPLNIACTLANYGELEYHLSRFEDCRRKMKSALTAAEGISHKEMQLKAAAYLTSVGAGDGQFDESVRSLQEILAEAEKHGDPRITIIAGRLLGSLLLRPQATENDRSRGVKLLEKSLATARQVEISHEIVWIEQVLNHPAT